MAVMVVHNETDRIYFQIKTLREGLGHVKPARTLKSCCLWDFSDKIFDENNHVLVIVSKQCQSFRKVVLRSFHNYKERCSTLMCRVCVVFETESCVIEEDFESLIGKETFQWLMICVNQLNGCQKSAHFSLKRLEGTNH